MRILLSILGTALLLNSAQAAVETLYVQAQPVVALTSTPSPDAVIVRRLTPGDPLIVVGRQPGFVHVQLADGVQGWLRDSDVTAAAPPIQRIAVLERENTQLRQQLATAQDELRGAQARLRQAQQAATTARESGAGEAAALETERDSLRARLATREVEVTQLQTRVAELEMAQQMAQDAARLLATRETHNPGSDAARFSRNELIGAAAVALGLALSGAWFGMSAARRRLRQRYHGLDL
jgi:hypothetical protein